MQNSDLQKNEENLYFVKNAQVSDLKLSPLKILCNLLWL